jgi:hypothetical protein
MNGDWSLVAELFFGFVHLSNQFNEPLSARWHSLFRPIGKLELANGSRLSILQVNISINSSFNNYCAVISSILTTATQTEHRPLLRQENNPVHSPFHGRPKLY